MEEDKKRREEKEKKFIESFPYKHRLIIRVKGTFSSGEGAIWDNISNGSCVIMDKNEKPIYIAKAIEGFWTGKYKYKVTNIDNKVIGYVRQHIINFGYPFVKERHGCTVKSIGTKEKYRLTTYLFFKEREFGGSILGEEGAYKVKYKEDKKWTKEYKILKQSKKIAHIYEMSYSDGFLEDKYIVGYNNVDDENMVVLNSIAIHAIMHVI